MMESVQYGSALVVSGLIRQELNLECLEYRRLFSKCSLFCKIYKEEAPLRF